MISRDLLQRLHNRIAVFRRGGGYQGTVSTLQSEDSVWLVEHMDRESPNPRLLRSALNTSVSPHWCFRPCECRIPGMLAQSQEVVLRKWSRTVSFQILCWSFPFFRSWILCDQFNWSAGAFGSRSRRGLPDIQPSLTLAITRTVTTLGWSRQLHCVCSDCVNERPQGMGRCPTLGAVELRGHL